MPDSPAPRMGDVDASVSAGWVAAAVSRIVEIDKMFEAATGWRSWMVSCANEREYLVDRLRDNGAQIEHRYQAHLDDGARTS